MPSKATSSEAGGRVVSSSAEALERVVSKFAGGYRSVGSMVYEVIRDAIISGAFAPGERLRQEMLAEVIGVSRLPIRSALTQLQAEGLVEFHEHRGAVVKTLSADQIREIYELRKLLEGMAVRHAVTTITPERLSELRELADRIARSNETHADPRGQFYELLYDAEGNPLRWQIIEDLRVKVGGYVLGRRLGAPDTHLAILDHIDEGDAEGAVEVLNSYLQEVCEAIVAIVEPGDVEED